MPKLLINLMIEYFGEKGNVGIIIHMLLEGFEQNFGLLDANLF